MTYLKGITCSLGCPDTSSDCHAVKPNSMVNSRPPAKRKILNYKNNNYSLETIKEHVNIIADKKEGKDSQTTCKKEIKQKLIILQRVRFVKLFRRICSARHICLLWSCDFIIYISSLNYDSQAFSKPVSSFWWVSAGLVSLSFEQITKSGRETSWIHLKGGSGCT